MPVTLKRRRYLGVSSKDFMFGIFTGKTEKLIADAISGDRHSRKYLCDVLLDSNTSELDRVPEATIQRYYKAVLFHYIHKALLWRDGEINLDLIKRSLKKSGVDFPDTVGQEIELYIPRKNANLFAPKSGEWLLNRLDQMDSSAVLKGEIYAHAVIMQLDGYLGWHMAPIKTSQAPDFGSTVSMINNNISTISKIHKSELIYMYLNLFSYFFSLIEFNVHDSRSHRTPDYKNRLQESYLRQSAGEMEDMFLLAECYIRMVIYIHPNPGLQLSFHEISNHNSFTGFLKQSIMAIRTLNSNS